MTGHGSVSIRITERDPQGIATLWLAECQCGEDFTGPDYKDAEAAWDTHRNSRHHWEESDVFDARLLKCTRCYEVWWPDTEEVPPSTVCTPVEVAA